MNYETKLPFAETKLPFAETKLPFAETKLPLAETKLPFAETKLPLAKTKLPLAETKLPLAETKLPLAETKLPLSKLNRYNRIIVFDVETNGLIKKDMKPYILQLSFIIYNVYKKQIEKTCNYYINVQDSVSIDPFITGLTGITREICNSRGVDILDALFEFYNCYMTCDCVVAHNLEFDKQMIQIEIQRNMNRMTNKYFYMMLFFNDNYSSIFNIDTYCTMKTNIEFCSIYFQNSKKKKYPKLIELYQKLFNETPENLHNSLIDVLVCLRCFLKRRFEIIIPPRQFEQLLSIETNV